jgi:hypothetical protein
VTDWRPIDTAPKDGSVILGWCPDAVRVNLGDEQVWTWPKDAALHVVPLRWHEPNERTSDEAGWYAPFVCVFDGVWDDPGSTSYSVGASPTHWMPLPEPPQSERTGV